MKIKATAASCLPTAGQVEANLRGHARAADGAAALVPALDAALADRVTAGGDDKVHVAGDADGALKVLR